VDPQRPHTGRRHARLWLVGSSPRTRRLVGSESYRGPGDGTSEERDRPVEQAGVTGPDAVGHSRWRGREATALLIIPSLARVGLTARQYRLVPATAGEGRRLCYARCQRPCSNRSVARIPSFDATRSPSWACDGMHDCRGVLAPCMREVSASDVGGVGGGGSLLQTTPSWPSAVAASAGRIHRPFRRPSWKRACASASPPSCLPSGKRGPRRSSPLLPRLRCPSWRASRQGPREW